MAPVREWTRQIGSDTSQKAWPGTGNNPFNVVEFRPSVGGSTVTLLRTLIDITVSYRIPGTEQADLSGAGWLSDLFLVACSFGLVSTAPIPNPDSDYGNNPGMVATGTLYPIMDSLIANGDGLLVSFGLRATIDSQAQRRLVDDGQGLLLQVSLTPKVESGVIGTSRNAIWAYACYTRALFQKDA